MGSLVSHKQRMASLGPGWEATGKGTSRQFRHESGWRVEHCGHPTALYPWAVYDPQGVIHTSGAACDKGYAFRLVGDALAHVAQHMVAAHG